MSGVVGREDLYRPLFITCAVTGGDVLPSQSSAVPRGVSGIASEAVAAAEAGAAMVHIHARDESGRPTPSGEVYAEIVRTLRARSDVVICISTGGAPGMSAEERLEGVRATRPEVATLNLGTMNYVGFPDRSRWPSVSSDWEREILESSASNYFVNTLAMVREFAAEFKALGVCPELEVYDLGHLGLARALLDEGTLVPPVRIQFVLGVLGGADSSLDTLVAMTGWARRMLSDGVGRLAVAAVGFPMQFRVAAAALTLGLDCRVGLEDNLRVARARAARGNAELVGVAKQLFGLLGRTAGSPADLRRELGPWAS